MAEHLTERQKKWFASVREGIERDTGKSLDEWVAIARTCPETRMMPRLQWFKRDGWSERLKGSVVLGAPGDFDAALRKLLKQAWETS